MCSTHSFNSTSNIFIIEQWSLKSELHVTVILSKIYSITVVSLITLG